MALKYVPVLEALLVNEANAMRKADFKLHTVASIPILSKYLKAPTTSDTVREKYMAWTLCAYIYTRAQNADLVASLPRAATGSL